MVALAANSFYMYRTDTGRNASAIQNLVNLVNEQHPDLIVFTGDLVNHRAIELNDFQHILAGLKAKDGVYSILGNHDYGPYFRWKNKQEQDDNLSDLQQRQAAMGWKLLNNSHTILIQGNDSICLLYTSPSPRDA